MNTPTCTPTPDSDRGRPPDIPEVLPVAAAPVWAEPIGPVAEALPVEAPWAEPAASSWLVTRLIRGAWRLFTSTVEWLFGAATLIVGLAVLAALPILGFLSLGYLLEAAGRVGRTGRLRDGFIGVRRAARVGSLVAGTWLMLLPLRAVSSFLASAQIIAPDSPSTRAWSVLLTALTIGMGLHIGLACMRGGRFRYFLWPFGNLIWVVRRLSAGGYYSEARDAVWEFVTSLRLPYYFWLGLRGFVVGFCWLAIPVSVMALSRKVPPLAFVGGGLLVLVLMILPGLQAHFAAENRLRAGFELGTVLSRFGRAPWAFGFAMFVALLFALPLYLLKIEMIPREAAWLPSLVFIVFIFPSRLAAGWAYARSSRHEQPRHWFFAATGLLGMIPSAVVYVFFAYLSQYTSWGGGWSLYEQHAFLLPVPFMDM